MSFWGTRPSPFTSAEVTFLQALADHSFTDGQLLIGRTATGGIAFSTLTAGANVTITNGDGTITIASSGGSGGITIGTTTITSGTSGRILYDNAGVVGEMTTTGSGTVVALATSPSFTTPTLGVASATSINKVAITAPATSATLTIADGKTLTVSNTLTFTGTDTSSVAFGGGGTVVYTSNNLSVFAATTSSQLAGVISDETGSGALVFATSPTLVTPTLGVASATTINKVTLTAPATGSTLTIADGKTLTASVTMTLQGGDSSVLSIAASKTATINNSITFSGTDSTTMTFPSSSATLAGLGITQTFTGVNTFTPGARSSGVASYFTINAPADTGITAATESIGVNHTGATRTWADGTTATQREYLFQAPTYNKTTTSATFTKAATLAVSAAPTAGTGVTITNAYAFWVQAGLAQFDGTLAVVGHVTVEGVTSTGATGTGKLVFDTAPTFTTSITSPLIIGGSGTTGTQLTLKTTTGNGTTDALAIVGGNNGGTTFATFSTGALTIGTSGVFTTGTIELGAASDTTLARVSAGVVSIEGATIGTLSASQTWTGQNKFNNFIDVNNAITASGNAATVPVTFRLNTVTNNSAATLTITMTTTSAVDGQMTVVRILDFSAVAQTITWVNTENSTVSAPTTSNGSTTLPVTVGFQYNAGTSKWRCIASA